MDPIGSGPFFSQFEAIVLTELPVGSPDDPTASCVHFMLLAFGNNAP